jgi:hypothetical protein
MVTKRAIPALRDTPRDIDLSIIETVAGSVKPAISRGATPVSNRADFSVVAFFDDGTHHYVERWLGRREALMLAWHCFRRQEGKSGPINRIIITDGGDFTVFEWKRSHGITFPPPEEQ